MSVEEQLLLFRGRVLKDDQTISSCNINPNDTVLLVIHKHEEPGSSLSGSLILEPEQPPHVNPVPQLTEPVLRAFDRRLSGAFAFSVVLTIEQTVFLPTKRLCRR